MNRSTPYSVLALLLAGTMVFQACKKDEDEPTPTPTPEPAQFIANNSSFMGWETWPLASTFNGADPGLGQAHAGNDETAIRRVYIKDGQMRVNGSFPQGTILVKHSTNQAGTLNEYVAMVKRGGNYDTDHRNWEYFVLTPTSEIANDMDGTPLRGSALFSGACRGCHSGAASMDYVFTP